MNVLFVIRFDTALYNAPTRYWKTLCHGLPHGDRKDMVVKKQRRGGPYETEDNNKSRASYFGGEGWLCGSGIGVHYAAAFRLFTL